MTTTHFNHCTIGLVVVVWLVLAHRESERGVTEGVMRKIQVLKCYKQKCYNSVTGRGI